MNKLKLKGGSLSTTYLITDENFQFVRKECSTIVNREYGYQRWYSQLKRQQRYNHLFPGLFPNIIKYGVTSDGIAYFDMEYIPDTVTVYDFLMSSTSEFDISNLIVELIKSMHSMHSININSNKSAIDLYIQEEVNQKINDTDLSAEFNSFPISEFKTELLKYDDDIETFTHGNLTLENILYNSATNTITFIDPYEENIIDSKLCDYSQILQSCNSKYELHNNSDIILTDDNNFGLDTFNKIFNSFLYDNITGKQLKMVKLFEISQFIRMLPFKQEIDIKKMSFFYNHAINLFNTFKKNNT